jgi:uncharacterized protein (TIGR02284 family)
MNPSGIDQLKSLHTAAVDARKGYEEALEDSGKAGLTDLFRDMINLHDRHADDLAGRLIASGEVADENGSFMATVHRTIMAVRALFGGLDESVLPGLIDGEQRNADHYREALADIDERIARDLVARHQADIEAAIARMRNWRRV